MKTEQKMIGQKAKRILLPVLKLLIILIPIFYGLYVVWKYGVNVAYWDEMSFMEHKADFLSWDFLWTQHNEHRMLFPKLLTYAIGSIFAWNSKVFMYTSQLFLLIIYCLIIRIILNGKKPHHLDWVDAFETLCLGLCIYNTAQHQNLLWGFQVAWFMIVSLGALSYYCFNKYINTGKQKHFLFAMLLAVIVSYSSLHGLAVWGGYILVVFSRFLLKEKVSFKTCIAIVAICALTVLLYFSGWTFWPGHEGYASKDPNQIASYFLGQIGGSVLRTENPSSYAIAFFLVVVTLLWFVKCFVSKSFTENILYNGPMILGLGAAFFISLGRSNGGTGEIVQSRYYTNSMIYFSFFLLLCVKVVREYRSTSYGFTKNNDKNSNINVPCSFLQMQKKQFLNMFSTGLAYAGGFLFFCLFILLFFRNTGMSKELENSFNSRMNAKKVLANYEDLSVEDYQALYPISESDVDDWISIFEMMKREKINVFSEDTSSLQYQKGTDLSTLESYKQLPGNIIYTIDDVNNHSLGMNLVLIDDRPVIIRGWMEVSDIETKESFLRIGNLLFRLDWIERPDINTYFDSPNYYGFAGIFTPGILNDGKADLSLVLIDHATLSYVEQPIAINCLICHPANVEEGLYQIATENEHMFMVTENHSLLDGGNILASDSADSDDCLFSINTQSNGFYSIENTQSKKSLDITGVSAEEGANLQQFSYQNTSNQRWFFIQNGENTSYYIVSELGTCIAVDEASGNNIHMENIDFDDKSQRWLLTQVAE